MKAALLPLYLELYDISFPEIRPRINLFVDKVEEALKTKGLEIIKLPVCRIKEEFEKAISKAEESGAYAIITLHLAYSPSLESAESLAKTDLPIIIMDTTPTYEFGPEQSSNEIMFNHGIHGVQDMCNLLLRNKKDFIIEAGYFEKSDFIERITDHVKSASMAYNMKNCRTGIIGNPFKSMGDFAVDPTHLKESIGVETISIKPQDVSDFLLNDKDPEIEEEIAKDKIRFDISEADPALHRQSVKTGLALRRLIKEKDLSAFTVNFLDITKAGGFPIMPFLEISKSMARGTGYAGEGDVLTASLISALFSVYDEVTFTEMFCPDWANNSIFMSHMGELNVNLSARKPKLLKTKWDFSDTAPSIVATGCLKKGKAVYVNLAPGADNTFSLILASVKLLPESDDTNFNDCVRGWMQSDIPLVHFLKKFSQLGGTHHSALVYNGNIDVISEFGKIMGWKVHII
jgi:L-arabinose isomerase